MAPPRTAMRQTDDTVSSGLRQLVRAEQEFADALLSTNAQLAQRWRFCEPSNPRGSLTEFLSLSLQLARLHALFAAKLARLVDDVAAGMAQIELVVVDLLLVTRVVYAPLHVRQTEFKDALDAQLKKKHDAATLALREFLQTQRVGGAQWLARPLAHLHETLERVDIVVGSPALTAVCDETKAFLADAAREAAQERTLVDLHAKLKGSPLEMDLCGRALLCHSEVTLSRTTSDQAGLALDGTTPQPRHRVYCLDDGTVLFVETPQQERDRAAPTGLCINLTSDAVFLEPVPRSVVGDASPTAAMVLVGPSSSLLVSSDDASFASSTSFKPFHESAQALLEQNDSRTLQLKRGRTVDDLLLDLPPDLKVLLASPQRPPTAFPCFHDDTLPGIFWVRDAASNAWRLVELVQCGAWLLVFAMSGWRRHHLLFQIDVASAVTTVTETPRSGGDWALRVSQEMTPTTVELVTERRARIDFWYDQVSKAIQAAAVERKKREAQGAKALKAAADAEVQAAEAATKKMETPAPTTMELTAPAETESAEGFINVRARKRQRASTSGTDTVAVVDAPTMVTPNKNQEPESVVTKATASAKKKRGAKASSVDDAVAAAQRALDGGESMTEAHTQPEAVSTASSAAKRQRTPPVKTPKQRWVRRKTDDPDDAALEATQPATGKSQETAEEPAREPPAASEVTAETKAAPSIRIIFTGIEPTPKTFKKISAIPGASYEENIERATHVLAPKNTLKRTVKLLCGISCCDHILDERWLDESARARTAVYERQYCLQDTKAEAKWGFDLVKTMYDTPRAQRRQLFSGHRFFITPHKTVLPPVQDLAKIVERAGGSVATTGTPQAGDLLITSEGAMATAAVQKLVAQLEFVYSPELILSSILQQRLDLDQHRLSPQTPSKGGSRGRATR